METKKGIYRHAIISGYRADFIRTRLRIKMILWILKRYVNPLLAVRVLRKMVVQRRRFSGDKIRKMAMAGGNFHWDPYIPGLNSEALKGFFSGESERFSPTGKPFNRFNNVMIAITKKCPYHCEHCYEWDILNQADTLSRDDLVSIIRRFQEMGTGQIQLTGGEPMLKAELIRDLVSSAKPGTEFSIFTSGYNLTAENARMLKDAGLTSVFISLDHYDRDSHDLFRRYLGAFDHAMTAVAASQAAGLVTILSLCATRSFVTESNLMAYASLAKDLGVSFIQLLEPRSTGHFSGREVSLGREQVVMMEDFFMKMNYDRSFRHFPVICYHGFYQRRIGCLGSADRSLYVDTDGNLHPCPFCRVASGNALSPALEDTLEAMKQKGCSVFGHSNFLAG